MPQRRPLTTGAMLLRERLAQRPRLHTQASLAQALGVSQQAISAWRRGECLPSAPSMRKLEDLLGIAMRAWLDSPVASPDRARTRSVSTRHLSETP